MSLNLLKHCIEAHDQICVQNVVCSTALVFKGPCDQRAVFKGPVFKGPVIKSPVTSISPLPLEDMSPWSRVVAVCIREIWMLLYRTYCLYCVSNFLDQSGG